MCKKHEIVVQLSYTINNNDKTAFYMVGISAMFVLVQFRFMIERNDIT